MAMEANDADLALLSSVFEDHSSDTLLHALKVADGDVQRATEALLARDGAGQEHASLPSKRRRTNSLMSSWLTSSKEATSHKVKERDSAEGPSARQSLSEKTQSPKRNLNDVLRATPSSTASGLSSALPPLTLTSAEIVAKHLPCSLVKDILPKELAAQLYLAVVADSQGKTNEDSDPWFHNRWYLNDKLVESTHSTTFFVSKHQDDTTANYNECAQFWYAGSASQDARTFLPEMEAARKVIEPNINAMLRNDPDALKRAGREKKPIPRFHLEYDGPWRGNVAAANCYRGSKETVGYHADQLTYLGPYPTIASLSLGVTRQFRLRLTPSPTSTEVPRTYSIDLPHNSLLIMHPPCQEHYKHTIPPQRNIDVFRPLGRDGPVHTERINITFRFYRPDFRPKDATTLDKTAQPAMVNPFSGTSRSGQPQPMLPAPETPICHCGIPTILRADQKGKAVAAAAARGTSSTPALDHADPSNPRAIRFFWQCQAGQQNEGKRCNFFKFLDIVAEGRGPCVGDAQTSLLSNT